MSHALVIDLGGTYTRFALMSPDYQISCQESFINNQFSSFNEVINTYLNQYPQELTQVDECAIAVAGPVNQRCAKLTNIDWQLDADKLCQDLPFSRVEIINDFHSLGYSVPLLTPTCVTPLQVGKPNPQALRVVLGAGTGLGIALVQKTQNTIRVFPSEGGHIDFAPINPRQERLLKFLQNKYQHVSVEHILSGHGLEHVFEFICKEEGAVYNDIIFDSLEHTCNDITGRKVIQLCNERQHPAAIATVKLFSEVYAAYIGNIALLTLPYGGIYITGGIARHILPFLQEEAFLTTYLAKGRLSHLLTNIPIYYIVNKQANLLGAGVFLNQTAKHVTI